jgi:hypothetical protein
MSILLDTNILIALSFPKDANHQKVRAAPVLPELFYMITARLNYSSAIQAFDMV